MSEGIEELKSVLRSLVVSSPTQVTAASLLRDYKNMLGSPLPIVKYGHRDPVQFLKERFSDCFLFGGPPGNPVLTLIVPDKLKHIDKFVKHQKSSSGRSGPKRRSVLESIVSPPQENLICKTFKTKVTVSETVKGTDNFITNTSSSKNIWSESNNAQNNHNTAPSKTNSASANNNIVLSKTNNAPTISNIASKHNASTKLDVSSKSAAVASKPKVVPSQSYLTPCDYNGITNNNKNIENSRYIENKTECENVSADPSNAVKNFLKKRLPVYDSLHHLHEEQTADRWGKTHDDDSGRLTGSSGNSAKAQQLDQLKSDIMVLITDAPEGVWCTDLIRLYRERYNRELNFSRFGFTSILSLVYCLENDVQITRPVETGDWLIQERVRASTAPHALRQRRSRTLHLPAHTSTNADPEEALPGIDFDPDVFPEDCMHFMESIESLSLNDFRPGAMIEVMIGEVYSPSHFWFIRLGDNFNVAMEDMMDEMSRYYNNEGSNRVLARGAVRVGHYCSSLYEKDWHRSLIVKIVDSDTVKVRHVDYGTVDTVSISSLKPLRREWAQLPAQAGRARLAGVRPPAAGWRWPRAAAAAFLALVSNRRLVANVVAIDHRDMVAEVLLIDTSSKEDVCIGTELIRAGHADTRPDSALRTLDVYLYPRFEALESGATPNYAEIHAYLRDGIALDYVEEYRAHVPAVLPDPPAASDSSDTSPASPEPTDHFTTPDTQPLSLLSPEPLSPTSSESGLADSPVSLLDSEHNPDSQEPIVPEVATRIPLLLPEPSTLSKIDSSPKNAPSPPQTDSSPKSAPTPVPIETKPETRPKTIESEPKATPAKLADTKPQGTAHSAPPSQPMCQPHPVFPPPSYLSPLAPVYVPGAPYPMPPQAYRTPAPSEFSRSPPPPYGVPPQQTPPAGVTLSLAEVETYRALSHVNPAAAHWFIVGAMGRAVARPTPPPTHPPHPPHPPMFPPPHPQMHPPHLPMHPMHPPLRIRPPPGFGS